MEKKLYFLGYSGYIGNNFKKIASKYQKLHKLHNIFNLEELLLKNMIFNLCCHSLALWNLQVVLCSRNVLSNMVLYFNQNSKKKKTLSLILTDRLWVWNKFSEEFLFWIRVETLILLNTNPRVTFTAIHLTQWIKTRITTRPSRILHTPNAPVQRT